eukprot:EG_transcript_14583
MSRTRTRSASPTRTPTAVPTATPSPTATATRSLTPIPTYTPTYVIYPDSVVLEAAAPCLQVSLQPQCGTVLLDASCSGGSGVYTYYWDASASTAVPTATLAAVRATLQGSSAVALELPLRRLATGLWTFQVSVCVQHTLLCTYARKALQVTLTLGRNVYEMDGPAQPLAAVASQPLTLDAAAYFNPICPVPAGTAVTWLWNVSAPAGATVPDMSSFVNGQLTLPAGSLDSGYVYRFSAVYGVGGDLYIVDLPVQVVYGLLRIAVEGGEVQQALAAQALDLLVEATAGGAATNVSAVQFDWQICLLAGSACGQSLAFTQQSNTAVLTAPAGGTLLVNVSAQFLGCPRCNVAQTTALVTLASTVSLRLLRPAGWNSYSPTTDLIVEAEVQGGAVLAYQWALAP